MGLFSKKQEQNLKEILELEERIKKLDRFSGSLSEYNILKGFDHEIIDTKKPGKYVDIKLYDKFRDYKLLKYIIDEGCSGLIRFIEQDYKGWMLLGSQIGIPVKPLRIPIK